MCGSCPVPLRERGREGKRRGEREKERERNESGSMRVKSLGLGTPLLSERQERNLQAQDHHLLCLWILGGPHSYQDLLGTAQD